MFYIGQVSHFCSHKAPVLVEMLRTWLAPWFQQALTVKLGFGVLVKFENCKGLLSFIHTPA